jgi:hypothetical protein
MFISVYNGARVTPTAPLESLILTAQSDAFASGVACDDFAQRVKLTINRKDSPKKR